MVPTVGAPPMPEEELVNPINKAAGRHPADAVETALWHEEIKLIVKQRKDSRDGLKKAYKRSRERLDTRQSIKTKTP